MQEDLKAILERIESQLASFGFGWENVLYVHLYIDDMTQFSVANEMYVKFITHERCPFGVPSRSTVEMPLHHLGFGGAYAEVLVTNNQNKKVLHVQSISCWAPSCIGPYSQVQLLPSAVSHLLPKQQECTCLFHFIISLRKLTFKTTESS